MSDSKSGQSNRRRARRHKPKGSTKVACYPGSMGLGANLARGLRDLSETGARLLARVPLEPGQEVELRLEGVNHRGAVRVLGRVVWVRPEADDAYDIGVLFQ